MLGSGLAFVLKTGLVFESNVPAMSMNAESEPRCSATEISRKDLTEAVGTKFFWVNPATAQSPYLVLHTAESFECVTSQNDHKIPCIEVFPMLPPPPSYERRDHHISTPY